MNVRVSYECENDLHQREICVSLERKAKTTATKYGVRTVIENGKKMNGDLTKRMCISY